MRYIWFIHSYVSHEIDKDTIVRYEFKQIESLEWTLTPHLHILQRVRTVGIRVIFRDFAKTGEYSVSK